MRNVDNYRHYAQECIRWAAESKDQEERDTFLEMAKAWTRVGLVERDVMKQSLREGAPPIERRLN